MKDTSTHGLVNFFHTIGEHYCEFCILDKDLNKLSQKREYKDMYPPVHIEALQKCNDEIRIKIGEEFTIIRDGVILTKDTKVRWLIYKIKKIPKTGNS